MLGNGCTRSYVPQKAIKRNYNRDIELQRVKDSFNRKILNFDLGFTSYCTSLEKLNKITV